MSILRTRKNAPGAFLFALVLTMALPIISFAQGRGNGQGRGPGSNLDKKCAKFVNCHDARDGRVDVAGLAAFRSDRNQTLIYLAIVAIEEIVMLKSILDQETEESIATVTGTLIATTRSWLGGEETAEWIVTATGTLTAMTGGAGATGRNEPRAASGARVEMAA